MSGGVDAAAQFGAGGESDSGVYLIRGRGKDDADAMRCRRFKTWTV